MSNPEIGVIFPTKDIGADRRSMLDFAPRAEGEGVGFVVAYDHVVGVNPERHPGWDGTFNASHNVHEPLILFSAMSAQTDRIKLVTGVLVAPQRQTALIAKQAAELDIISNGRLILGVGIGWNKPEFEALGADFSKRAQKLEEQIGLLRKLWGQKNITAESGSEKMKGLDLNPLPQRQIPIWVGGLSEKAIERAARLSDGWMPLGYMDKEMTEKTNSFWRFVNISSKSGIGLMGRVNPWIKSYQKCVEEFKQWVDQGATHIAIGSSHETFKNTEQYFSDLSKFREYLGGRI